MKNIIFIIGLFLFTSQGFADEIFDIEFTEPIKINETKTAQAKITGLTAEAKEAGFAVMLLAGDVRYESTGDNQVRVYITWKNLTDGKNLTQPLTSEFTSQFRTDDPVVKTGQSITAAGSQADLGNSMYAFKERLDVDTGAPEAAVNKPAEASADEFGGTPDYFSGAAGGGGSFGGSSDPNAELDEIEPVDPQNNQVTTEACELRIDYGKRAGFLQVKEITTNLITGQKTDGVCSDTGETVPFVRELSKDCGLSFDHTKRAASKQYVEFVSYDGQRIEVTGCTPDKTASIPYERVYDDKTCSVVPDFSGGKIYVQYKEYVLDDFTGNQTVKVEVTGCTNDHSKSYELKSTNEGCGFRSDFVQGKTYLQRKYRYTNSAGEVIDASSCQDSSTSYDNFLTDRTCQPEQIDGQVFIYKKWAFTDGDGIIHYISDCEPIETETVPFRVEFCPDNQKYEDDFVSGQSFYRTRPYYVDTQQIKHYLTECTRDSSAAFAHEFEQCGTEHDDTSLISTIKFRKIVKMTGETRELEECGAKVETIPYIPAARNEREIKNAVPGNYTFTVPSGVKQVSLLLVGGGTVGAKSYDTGHGIVYSYYPLKGGVLRMVYPVTSGEKIGYRVGKHKLGTSASTTFGTASSASGVRTGYGSYGQSTNRYSQTFGYIEISHSVQTYKRYDGTIYTPDK